MSYGTLSSLTSILEGCEVLPIDSPSLFSQVTFHVLSRHMWQRL